MSQQEKNDDLEKTVDEGIQQAASIKEKAKTHMSKSQQVFQRADEVEGILRWTRDHIEGFRLASSDSAHPLFGVATRFSNTLGTIAQSLKNADDSLTEATPYIQPALSGCLACASSSAEGITAFRAEYSSSYQMEPAPDDSVARIYFDKGPSDHKKAQADLDSYLKALNPELPDKRKDAWTTFHSNLDNKDSLACYAMRDILTGILNECCSVNSVKAARWWKEVKETSEGVSKLQKIKFFICGQDDSDIESTLMEFVTNGVEECKRLHDTLNSVAHGASEEKVRRHLEAMESALLNMFQLRKSIEDPRARN